jgi:hypothetical protein
VCAEANAVLRAVAADFFFKYWCLEIPSDNLFGTYQGASTIMRKAFDCKSFRISMFGSGSRTQELYSVSPDWFEYCFIYEKFVACREF